MRTTFESRTESNWYGLKIVKAAHALAHLVDAAVIQINTDIIGASLNGTAKYGFWTYFKAATIQMRNIKYLGVVSKLFALAPGPLSSKAMVFAPWPSWNQRNMAGTG